MSGLRKCVVSVTMAALCVVLCESCGSSGCTDNQNSLPLAGFYSSATGDEITLKGIDVGGVGAWNDSLLYNSTQQVSEVYLPFRSTSHETSFYFHYTQDGLDDDAFNDTLSFEYGSTPHFASEYCGVIYRYNITKMSYTTHLIDSVIVVDSLITNIDKQRLKIYFRTSTE